MQKAQLLVLFIVFTAGVCFPQSGSDPLSQGTSSQGASLDCSDPTIANTPLCSSALQQRSNSIQGSGGSSLTMRVPMLTTPYGFSPDQYTPTKTPLNPSQIWHRPVPTRPETEFEQMVADSVGRPLPLFGQSLFVQAPSTFSPVDFMQVPSDYIIGPGDELQIRVWGQVEANLRVIVDRSGQIYIPQVGQISVAGIHYGDLEQHLKSEISKIFKNFNVTASIGRLRSIQIIVVGNARYPGTYTISSLSTLVNAIFASGGPTPQGSLRDIQVRRDGATITDFDFYDLLIKGDKSKDVRLLPGDVLYIPHVGPLVAISGSVNSPAIYEMKDNSTLNDLIEIAGDLSTVADTNKITIDRFVEHQSRKTLEFPYDAQSRCSATPGWRYCPRFFHRSAFRRYRYPTGQCCQPRALSLEAGHAHQRSDSRRPGIAYTSLLAQSRRHRQWSRHRISGSGATSTDAEQPLHSESTTVQWDRAQQHRNTWRSGLNSESQFPGDLARCSGFLKSGGRYLRAERAKPIRATILRTPAILPPGVNRPPQAASSNPNNPNPNTVRDIAEDVRRYAPEINWDYAIIQRVNPIDLSSKLLWMSPRKAILEHDEASNLELQPGDIITIFSQRDITVPQTERSQYVIVEGEVRRPGVYKLETNETLRSVLQRAGGLTPNAYVYGSQLTRESARVDQQKSLDQLANTMEVQIRQSAVSVAASASPGELPQLLAAQQAIIDQLRSTRASGRVALPVKPKDNSLTDFPDMVMEDSDRLTIPHTPSTVSVVGDVYNPGSFIYEPRSTAGAYLEIAGKGKPQSDMHHAFVLRANGVVVAANNVNGLFTGTKFDRIRVYPGDQIVVPYKLPTGAFIRGLRDWTQITSQLAITGAALAIIAP